MIQIENLDFSYKKRQKLFQGLDLDLPPGSIIGLLGKNGAGKTSLLKLMAGLLYPKKGSCKVFDKESHLRLPSMLSDLYFLPEEIYAPLLKVSEFVKLYAPFYPNFSADEFARHLKEFEIESNGNLRRMSFGQKKKVLISFSLATNCRLLLMDEPTNGLDIPSKSQFRRIIASSVSDDRSIIISTHQIRDLGLMIDPVLILDKSRFILNRSQDDILKTVSFVKANFREEIADALYVEEAAGMLHAIVPKRENVNTLIDIELLFNAAISSPQLVELFKTKSHE
ncbi:MAG: ABC transporter ATP-binding protein [Bacteroidota bacterium]